MITEHSGRAGEVDLARAAVSVAERGLDAALTAAAAHPLPTSADLFLVACAQRALRVAEQTLRMQRELLETFR